MLLIGNLNSQINFCIHSLGSIKISMYSSVALICVFLGSVIVLVFKVGLFNEQYDYIEL